MAAAQGQSPAMSDHAGPLPSSQRSRTYFHRVEPTFSVTPSSQSTRLEFVDNADPEKSLVVRRKAREWVQHNKEHPESSTKRKNKSAKSRNKASGPSGPAPDAVASLQNKSMKRAIGLFFDPSSGRIDPFSALPDVGRPVHHIIEYFLTQCPEEVPGSDDKYAWRNQNNAIQPSRNNTVLGTMAAERVSFILWLHATTVIRDGTAGNWMTEECLYYYKLALKVMQEETTRKIKDYTDSFISAFACFTAVANFAGQYKAAEMHRDALLKAVTLKGGGNLAEGVRRLKPWTQGAIGWCEFHVAAQTPSLPKLPYNPPHGEDLPPDFLAEASRLASTTLSNLPRISDPFPTIILQLHILSLSQSQRPPSRPTWPVRHKIDVSVVRPLYCAEFTLLELLSAQQHSEHHFSPFEVAVTEACQLYLWTAVRGLPPEIKMCDLFVARLKKALGPFVGEVHHEEEESTSEPGIAGNSSPGTHPTTMWTTSGPSIAFDKSSGASAESSPVSVAAIDTESSSAAPATSTNDGLTHISNDHGSIILNSPEKYRPFLIWALFLGTLISSVGPRPEYCWYTDRLRKQIFVEHAETSIFKDELRSLLKLFPYTEELCGLGLSKLDILSKALQ